MPRLALVVLALAALPLGMSWYGCTPRTRTPDAVFLIVVDTLRPDRLSCYGYAKHTTDSIDALAQRGVRFDRAQSVASWTVPSMGAMMTSLYPTQLGLVETPSNGQLFKWRERREQLKLTIALEERTLAEMLHEAGFYSAGFVNQPGINFKNGFLQGFDEWYYPVGIDEVSGHDPTVPLPYRKWAPSLQYADRMDQALVERFDEWLGSNADKRVFAWVHLLTTHLPYLPHGKYKPKTVPPTPSENYDGEVLTADDMVGDILETIDRNVGLDKALVVFVSDHGEAFGEHGMLEHGHTLHNEVLHVPLILSGPGIPAGRVVETYVRLIDILPTILDVVDAEQFAPSDIAGESLMPLIDRGGVNRPVYSEAMLYGSTERSLIGSGYKLMYDEQGDIYQLFDVMTDAGELTDVASAKPAVTDTLTTALTGWYARLQSDYLQRSGEAPDTTLVSDEEAEQILQIFKSLGYVNK